MRGQASRGQNVANNIIHIYDEESPGCSNVPNPNKTTAYQDSVASTLIIGRDVACKVADVQQHTISLNTPSSRYNTHNQHLGAQSQNTTKKAGGLSGS